MKTTFKILMLIILFSILFISTVNAAGILMNLEDYTQNIQNAIENESQFDNNVLDNETDISNESEIETEEENVEDDTPKVTHSKSSNDDEFLTTENILSIIIIVIGILLVFFAVAILIRIK